jgi:hypothetical protein
MESEIIKEENGLRVSLMRGEYPDEPYDDGQPPLIRIDRGYGYGGRSAEHIMIGSMRPTGDDSRIEEAAARWAGEPDKFEKYVRAYHGATQVKWYGPTQSTDYTYVTYDTPAWRKAVGIAGGPVPGRIVNMDEYIAYLEGEVYVYVVEREVHVKSKKDIHVNGEPLRTEESEYDEWEHVDSCGGFYGEEYAKEAALEALDYARTDTDPNSVPTGR